MKSFILFLLCIPFATSQCPKIADIDPCKCIEISSQGTVVAQLSCWGNMSLPQLTTILRESMCGRTVEKFELWDTNITYLPSNLFSRMIVKEINIYLANITRFTYGGQSAFYGLEGYLKSLALRRCFLLDNLRWEMFHQMYTLSYLDLSYNKLTRIPVEWRDQPPPKLRSLLLKGNKISSLEPGALQWMFSLVELDLSENWIATISRDALPISGNSLIILRLSYNKLENIPEDVFDGLLALKRIYLDSNNITNVNENTWRHLWGDLDTLDLNNNYLQCDNSALWTWTTTLRRPVRLYGTCTDGELQGKHLKALTLDDFSS